MKIRPKTALLKKLFPLLLFALPVRAQTPAAVNQGMVQTSAASATVTWTHPQNQNDTNVLAVYGLGGLAGAKLGDAAGDAYLQDCVSADGTKAIYHAPTQSAQSNSIVLTLPAPNYIGILASEQKGQWALDTCGLGSASTTGLFAAVVIAAPASPPQSGDLAYGFLEDQPGESMIEVPAAFSVLNGRPAPWWGAAAYTGYFLDEVGTGTPTFLLEPGTGPNSATILAAWYKPASAPVQPKNFTFSGSVLWNDGTPVQGTIQAQQFQASQVWNTLATVTPDASGNISGTITVETNFADLVTLNFILDDATGAPVGFIQPSAPGALFQGISRVSGFKLVIQKVGCAGGKACTLAAGSVFGTIQ